MKRLTILILLLAMALGTANAIAPCTGGTWSASLHWYTGPAGDVYPQPVGTCTIGNQVYNYNVSWTTYFNIKLDGL